MKSGDLPRLTSKVVGFTVRFAPDEMQWLGLEHKRTGLLFGEIIRWLIRDKMSKKRWEPGLDLRKER